MFDKLYSFVVTLLGDHKLVFVFVLIEYVGSLYLLLHFCHYGPRTVYVYIYFPLRYEVTQVHR